MEQLIAHLVGDYILQNHWMALNKTKNSFAAAVHAVTYTIPFVFLTDNLLGLLIILSTHFLIDRFRLAKYVCNLKNWTSDPSGFPDGTPAWLSVWLVIIVDNTMHLIINYLSLKV